MNCKRDHFVGAHALCSLLYCMAPIDLVHLAFPDVAEVGYLEEKAQLLIDRPATFFGSLDPDRFARVVAEAVRRYGEKSVMYANLGGAVS